MSDADSSEEDNNFEERINQIRLENPNIDQFINHFFSMGFGTFESNLMFPIIRMLVNHSIIVPIVDLIVENNHYWHRSLYALAVLATSTTNLDGAEIFHLLFARFFARQPANQIQPSLGSKNSF